MKVQVGEVVVPGDIVEEAEELAKQNKKVILGNIGILLSNQFLVKSKNHSEFF